MLRPGVVAVSVGGTGIPPRSRTRFSAATPDAILPLRLFGLGMLMNPVCNRRAGRQAPRRVTQHCAQVLAPLDLPATQLSMLRENGRLGPIALDPLTEAMVMDRASQGSLRSFEVIL